MVKFLMALLALLLWSVTAADPVAPSWLPPEITENAEVTRSENPSAESYRLVTSAIKKVDNRWRTESERVLSGHLTRTTYQLRPAVTYREARTALRQALESLPQDAVLYQCDGLDCGSSHAWANQVFNVKQLYGLDGSQFYAAFKVVTAGAVEYAGVYLVQRGNRRIHLQVDRLAPTPNVADAIGALTRYGYWLAVAGDAEALDLNAAKVLLATARERGLNLALVAHDFEPGASAARLTRSQAQAAAAGSRLEAAKLGAVPAFGVGDLAPRPGAPPQRLEWVLHQPAQ